MRAGIRTGSPAIGPRLAAASILVVAAALSTAPILRHAALPAGSDVGAHAMLSRGMIEGLSDGIAYPRWIDGANRGLGGPVFVFFPPLAYYGVAAAWTLVGDVVAAMRIAIVACAVAAAFSFYLWIRPRTSELAAALGGAVYVLLPYRALDLYDRFAFAELASLAWLPLPFLFAREVARTGSRKAAAGLALSYAGLVLTHMPTAYIGLLGLVPYALAGLGRSGRWRHLLRLALSGVAALALAAVYLVPLQLHRGNIHESHVIDASYGDWRRNLVFGDEVAQGYRRSSVKVRVERAVLAQGALALAALVAFLALRPGRRDTRFEVSVCAGAAAWAVFLQTPASALLWSTLPEMESIVFPWRFGSYQGLFTASLVSLALAPEPRAPRRLRVAAASLLALALLPSLWWTHELAGLRRYTFGPRQAERAASEGVWHAFVPRGVKRWRKIRSIGFGDERTQLEYPGRVEIVSWTSHSRHFRVRSKIPNSLWVRTFDYPGWRATLDGRPVPIRATEDLGAITVDYPPGEHEIRLDFALEWPWRAR